jgi:hypothetical protein
MKIDRKSLRYVAMALFLGVVVAGCAFGPNSLPPEIVQQIEAARTRGDHEALVAYYDREATAARAKAAEHRKMAKSYQGRAVSAKGGLSMPAHCNSIVSQYEGIAAEYDGMAAEHRQMAAGAPI